MNNLISKIIFFIPLFLILILIATYITIIIGENKDDKKKY